MTKLPDSMLVETVGDMKVGDLALIPPWSIIVLPDMEMVVPMHVGIERAENINGYAGKHVGVTWQISVADPRTELVIERTDVGVSILSERFLASGHKYTPCEIHPGWETLLVTLI